MFKCLICEKNGIEIYKKNLVPHILSFHKELKDGTKTYIDMFPGSKLREAPKTSYGNKSFRDMCVDKSVKSRIGKNLSEEHKLKIGSSNKESLKYLESRKILSEKFKTGELINCRKKYIDKNVLENLYLNELKSINEISTILNIGRDIISNELSRHEIVKRNRSSSMKIKHSKEDSISLSKQEIDVITGQLLGDGCLRKGKGITPQYIQSCKYIDFLLWIKSLLPSVVWSENAITLGKITNCGSRYFSLNSKTHQDFLNIHSKFYYYNTNKKKMKKKIPIDLKINETILLHWFLGDGHSYIGKDNSKEIAISACDFNEDDLERIVIPQIINMGINCRVKKRKQGPVIKFYAESYENFYKKIGIKSPVACYSYKFEMVEKLFPHLLENIKEEIIVASSEESFNNYRANGFPFIKMSSENKLNSFKNLIDLDVSNLLELDVIKINRVGLKLANYYHPQIFNIKTKNSEYSPLDIFQNDLLLKKITEDLKEKYNIIKDSDVRSRCRYISNSMIMNFRPTIAKFITKMFTDKKSVVLDPCAGFGGRLLGCTSCEEREYIGIDPEYTVIKNLERMSVDLGIENRIKLFNLSYENFEYNKESIDLILTSPPYYDLEHYNQNDPEQSNIKYKTYEEWKNGFLSNLIEKSYSLLKNKCYFCINLKNTEYPIADDFFQLSCKLFDHITTYRIEFESGAIKNNEYRYEQLFIFKKGS